MENKGIFKPLKSPLAFEKLKSNGHRLRMAHWGLVSYGPNELKLARYGFTIPKYVGSAVIRNRFRRWGRELFRGLNLDLGSCDINVVFLRKTPTFYKELGKAEFDRALQTALGKISSGRH